MQTKPHFLIATAMKGYALNKMCHSFNRADNRAAFLADPDAYCDRYGLNEEERAAIRSRRLGDLVAAGGNPYFVSKFARVFREPSPHGTTQLGE
jgi:protocatechuate 4,5-dioxygenase alpha chain